MNANRNKVLDIIFYVVMGLCLIATGFALVFFIISLFNSNSMIAQSTISKLKLSEDISLEGYLKLQMQLQEIRSSAIQTNTLTFLYQFISGTMIGVAGYLIKISTDRVKDAEKMTKDIEEKAKTIENKVVQLTNATTQITESQLKYSKDLIDGRAFSYINHLYSSLQAYVFLSISSNETNEVETINQKNIIIKTINQEIFEFQSFFNASIELMDSWKEEDKKLVLNRMLNEMSKLGEILRKETITPADQFESWNEKIESIIQIILAILYPI